MSLPQLAAPIEETANDNSVPVVSSPLGGAMLVHVINPMVPQLGARRFGHCEGLTVLEAVERAGWSLPSTTVLVRDGHMIARSEWDASLIGWDEVVFLVTMPQNGGKGGGSQILALIATIALVIFAPQIGAFLLSQIGIAGTAVAFAGVTAGTLATVGVVLAGSLLITALLPKPKPMTDPAATSALQSPTYSLNAQSNSARLLDVIPERFGTFKFFPDLAAQAYFDFINSNQELKEEFCLGMGEFEILEIGISNNAVWRDGAYTGTYPEMEVQLLPPGVANTLFSDNVVTSGDVSNVELLGTNEDGYAWSGPFVLNPTTTLAHQLDVDLSIPGGLFSVDDKGSLLSATVSFQVQVQLIDDAGTTLGGWTTVIDQTLNQSTRDAIRTTYSVALAEGRYQVRFERTNAKATDLNTSDQCAILAMRGYLPNAPAPNDTSRIALKATSTKNLNGDSAQQFYVIATRKLPLYDVATNAWSEPTATRSIAAAAAYLCKSQNGLRRLDTQIDLAKLWGPLHSTWTERGDNFDGVFDTADSAWTNLQAILRVGRAEPLRVGRWITFNRDEPKSVPRAAFSPANILAGSFNIDYVMFDATSTDALWIDIIDARNWQPLSVFCAMPDSTTDPDDAPHISVVGITDRDHGWREGIFMCAVNRYRRRFPNFSTELEGRICFRGDKILVAHWMPGWGGSGQVVDYLPDPGGDIVTISEPWNSPNQFNDDAKLVTLITPDGYSYGPVRVDLLDDGEDSGQAQVRLLEAATVTVGNYAGQLPAQWDIWGNEGADSERPRILYGTATQKAQDALMISMKPQTGNTVQMACVLDDQRVHYVDGTIPPIEGGGAPSAPEETNPPVASAADNLTITSLVVREVAQSGSLQQPNAVAITIAGAPQAQSFEAQWKWNTTTDYSPVSTGLDRTFNIQSVAGVLSVQVRAKGISGFGPWFATTFSAQSLPPSADPPTPTFAVATSQVWIRNSRDGIFTWTDLSANADLVQYLVTVEMGFSGVFPDPGSWVPVTSFFLGKTATSYTVSQLLSNPNGDPPEAVRVGVKPYWTSGAAADFSYPP